MKIIPDSRIRDIVSKGPKYRFPSQIDFNRCREEIASALNDFGNRWCKRESVECSALKEWKLSIFNIVDKRIKFYSHNTNLLLLNLNLPLDIVDGRTDGQTMDGRTPYHWYTISSSMSLRLR